MPATTQTRWARRAAAWGLLASVAFASGCALAVGSDGARDASAAEAATPDVAAESAAPRGCAHGEACPPDYACDTSAGGAGVCRPACNTSVSPTGCAPAQACTRWEWLRVGGDGGDPMPFCAPFCHADAECAAGLHCDRLGRCRAQPVDLSLSPDGDPCDLSRDPVDGVSTQCRGACLPMLSPRDVGVCASLIDERAGQTCPDRPERVSSLGFAVDNVAACGIATCHDDCDCTAPFQCIDDAHNGTGVCAPPDPTRGEHGTPCAGDAGVGASSSDAPLPDAAAD